MSIDGLKSALPEFAKDIKLNLGSLVTTSSLGEQRLWGTLAAIMAMNNVYYRSMHLIGDETYATMPARLRMTVIGNPGVDKVDFELWCLAVSALNGCGRCLESHESVLRQSGMPREQVQEAVRIAAVVNAVAAVLESEAALASI